MPEYRLAPMVLPIRRWIIAYLRALPNMTLISPCDANQARAATIAAMQQVNGPVYIRFGREPVPNFTDEDQKLVVGKGQVLMNGDDVANCNPTGHEVWESIEAAHILAGQGVNVMVVNIHTIAFRYTTTCRYGPPYRFCGYC